MLQKNLWKSLVMQEKLGTRKYEEYGSRININDRINIIISGPGSLESTINFLEKTGMPSTTRASVLLRSCNAPYRYYPNNFNSELLRKTEGHLSWNEVKFRLALNKESYTLFLREGAKISWGSILCLYNATFEKPDAAVISAVFRNSNESILLPRTTLYRFSPFHYIITYLRTRNLEIVKVCRFYQDAVLIRGDVLHALGDQILAYKRPIDLQKITSFGDIVCVLSAQLISLSDHTAKLVGN